MKEISGIAAETPGGASASPAADAGISTEKVLMHRATSGCQVLELYCQVAHSKVFPRERLTQRAAPSGAWLAKIP